MTDELTPVRCGCGGEAKVIMLIPEVYAVECSKCWIRTGSPANTETEAIEAWNRAMGATDIHVVDKFAKDINVPRKGKWQRRKGSDCWECSECHAVLENDDLGMHNFYFCYHCGADMMNKSGYMDIEEVHYE